MTNWSQQLIDEIKETKKYQARYETLLRHYQQQMVDLHKANQQVENLQNIIETFITTSPVIHRHKS